MGTLVTSTASYQTKPQYTVETVAFGLVAVADGEFASFIGADISAQVVAWDGLETCKEALRETGWPNPTTGVVVEAIYDTVTQSLTDTLSETCVAVIKGSDYKPAGFSCSPDAMREAEKWLESTAKAA